MQSVEQLADAHRGYAQLFDICTLQQNDLKLHAYMQKHRVMLPGNHLDLEQSAVAYVFDRYTVQVIAWHKTCPVCVLRELQLFWAGPAECLHVSALVEASWKTERVHPS